MENKNGQGIFYGVIGVATLIVAIIGATFAFFSATASNSGTINGTAATAGLNLSVTKISTDANGGLIPLNESDIAKALVGDTATDNVTCKDKNGNTVCQLYRIDVESLANTAVNLTGTLTLSATGEGNTYNALKWANFDQGNGQTYTGTNYPSAPTATTSNLYAMNQTALTTAESYTSLAKKSYFVLVYINNTDSAQETTNKGTFTGVVEFHSSDGSGVQATFTNTTPGGE